MDLNPMSPTPQRISQMTEPAGPASCPICGSHLIPLRGMLRCVLCCFVLCEACEGANAWEHPDGGQP
jgi:hypothetical protein